MTYNWKTGDRAMVTLVAGVDSDGDVRAVITHGTYRYLPASALSPLPPSTTPEAQAVLDAAVRWEDWVNSAASTRGDFSSAVFRDAVKAYRDTLPPADPVGDLIEVTKRHCISPTFGSRRDMLTAIAAVEASRA